MEGEREIEMTKVGDKEGREESDKHEIIIIISVGVEREQQRKEEKRSWGKKSMSWNERERRDEEKDGNEEEETERERERRDYHETILTILVLSSPLQNSRSPCMPSSLSSVRSWTS